MVGVPIVVNVIPVHGFIKGIVTIKVVLTKGQNSVLSFGEIDCPKEFVIVAKAMLNSSIIFFVVNVFILLNVFVSLH